MKCDFRKDLVSLCQSKLKTLAGINALNNRHAKKEKKKKKKIRAYCHNFQFHDKKYTVFL